jgi:hypothetical protein
MAAAATRGLVVEENDAKNIATFALGRRAPEPGGSRSTAPIGDLRPTGQRSYITLAGRQAERRDFLLPSTVVDRGRQLRERLRLVALPYRNGEYLYLLFVAPDEDFAGLQTTFNRMMNSLQLR